MASKRPFHSTLYFRVIVGILIGVAIGFFLPDVGQSLKPLGDAFIKLIKMMIAPIIFCTVVVGIAKMGHMKDVGRVGIKALVYFEVMSTVALIIGLVVVNVLQPGAGIHADPATLDTKAIANYATAAKTHTTEEFLMNIIPSTVVDAFAKGEILQVLLFAILFGIALNWVGKRGEWMLKLLDEAGHVLFRIIEMIMQLAPIGAGAAMAFTIGKYGMGTLLSLGELMLGVYITCFLFVFVVLGLVARFAGFNLWRFLVYIREEIFIVLGTSSSESVLPRMMEKMERLGCDRSVVGLVIPTGYSFNLDGTSIYLTMAAIFIAQATDVPLTLWDQLTILAVLLLTSKGAAAVTGGGFITLAATLSSVGKVPVAGLTLLLGVDRFLSEARSITNLIGNGVATIVVSRWEGAVDMEKAQRVLAGDYDEDLLPLADTNEAEASAPPTPATPVAG
ncbi:MAG TPA: dicarboxylate/amino acid:cation symporter [Burkholderiales bacterium]|nr:dicarboxylate/amino acid:cation symporter [Betaproteobacteria bacterium]HQR53087.1 dicarboxylate/amino acid:cation symporter [Burkholderiales bacterium]